MVRCCCLHVFDAVTCNLYSLLAGQSEGLCCAIRQRGWFRAETARVIRSVAHSFVYIQRLDIKPVYTAVDRSQHPYSAQEAARDKQTRIAVERSSLVFSVVQADSRALGQPSSAAGNTHIGWLECRLASSVGSNSTVGVSGRCAVLRHSHGSA